MNVMIPKLKSKVCNRENGETYFHCFAEEYLQPQTGTQFEDLVSLMKIWVYITAVGVLCLSVELLIVGRDPSGFARLTTLSIRCVHWRISDRSMAIA